MYNRVYIADYRYFEEINDAFGEGRIILPSFPCHSLPEPTNGHPDMTIFPLLGGYAICAPEVCSAYQPVLAPFGITLMEGKTTLNSDYPGDVAYNVLKADGCAFARWDSTDPEIAGLLDECGISRHNIHQGYARCSTVLFGHCMITADPSVKNEGEAAGFEVLSVSGGHVELPGYEYGFLGGASGILDGNTVAFIGDLSFHPDGDAIRQFIQNHGFSVAEIPGKPLRDIGTLLCIEL